MGEKRMPLPFHRRQEQVLLDILKRGKIPMQRVLELGCGYGRITKLLAQDHPNTDITALDLSPEQLANARRYCADYANVRFEEFDFFSGGPLLGADYDAVIAVEVFHHLPSTVLAGLIDKATRISRFLINIDWAEEWLWKVPEHIWIHDYKNLYAQTGVDSVAFTLPERFEGKQQKLFIAGREIPDKLLHLEAAWRDSLPSNLPPPGSPADPASPEGWWQHLYQAEQDVLSAIPPKSTFVLVDEEQWGWGNTLGQRRILPFLEKDGLWWGPPADDETALRELERMQLGGATHIVIGWPAFWWLERYREFHHMLRAHHRCVLENERLVVFALNR